MAKKREKSFEQVVREDGRYPLDAYAFLQQGLKRAVNKVHGESAQEAGPHHVSGQDLCNALREEAIERWGLLARTVLGRWNVRATIDFGNMVYLLVNNHLMEKTEQDSVEHFRDVYDFETAFAPPPHSKWFEET